MNMIFLTFVFPLIGFLLLSFSRGRWSENLSALVGVGSIGLSAIVTAYVIWQFNVAPPEGGHYTLVLWQWMSVEGFKPNFALYVDGLSITMLGVVVGVGFLIHLFASWYMRGEAGYSRFFSYTNLFIASMLFLVLGDNLLFLYFGWEGVGLCSYLLIGFYYSNRNNGNAALKAFIVTRIGDVFMAIGLFIPVAATMPNIAMAAPPNTAGGIEATRNAALGSRLKVIRNTPAMMVTERQRTPVICTKPIFWAKEECVKVLKKPARNEAPASHSRPRRSMRGVTSCPVILPSAKNIPVDSTKIITTTRHIDKIGAK